MACSELNQKIDPSCLARRKPGGLNKRMWHCQLSDVDSYVQDGTSKDISDITLKATKNLSKIIGRKAKHSGAYELQVGDNVNSVKQILNLVLYHETTLDREKIMNIANAEDQVFFVQNNAGQIEVFGLDYQSGTADEPEGGLNAESGNGGTGTIVNDDTSFKLSLSGDHRNLPPLFLYDDGIITPSLQESIDQLDVLASANA